MRRLFALTSAVLLVLLAMGHPPLVRSQSQESMDRPEKLQAEFVPGQVLVRFRPVTPISRVEHVLVSEGTESIRQVTALGVHVLRLPPGLEVAEAVERFEAYSEVAYAEPNYILRAAQAGHPCLEDQWAPQAINAPQAWGFTMGDPLVVIAIADTGIDYRHSELAPNIWTNAGEILNNGLDDDGNGYIDDVMGWDFVNGDPDPVDDNNHGSHVAGIAAATFDGDPDGLVGVCPNCSLMPVKVLGADGSGSIDVAASGVTYAVDNGAKVVNLSLGALLGSSTLESAVNYAWDRGAVVVAAAGNDGLETAFYPASYANVIGVGSTNAEDHHSCFSNYGVDLVSVAAPGEMICSALSLNESGEDDYGLGSGTSMAAPHVAGLAGLLFSDSPGLTNTDARAAIEATAVDVGPAGTDSFYGNGRIDAYRALTGDTSPTTPATGLYSTETTASGYAHARKLARDANDTLHLVWHGEDGGLYRVLYANSIDDGLTWSVPEPVFSSSAETYHPGLAIDGTYAYVVFPSRDGAAGYQTFFSRMPLSGGSWSAPVALMGGGYDAVRPDIFVDPTTGRLHVVAASLDNAPDVYYTASDSQGDSGSWTGVQSINPSPEAYPSNTRYATVYAHGDNVYIAARTLYSQFLFTTYYLQTVRSTNGGQDWSGQEKISSCQSWTIGERGVSLAGAGDRLYMVYEVCGKLYFRKWEAGAWSDYELLEESGVWPSVSQAADGQAWMIWEDAGSLLMRHYTGEAWEAKETIHEASIWDKRYYPNLKLGTSGGRLEWVVTSCCGAPFRLVTDGRTVSGDLPPSVTIAEPLDGQSVEGVYRVLVSASDDSAVSLVQLSIDGDGYLDISASFDGTHYYYDWDTTSYANGAHTLQARAEDDTGQGDDSDIVNVTVDNANESPLAAFSYTCTDLSCDFDASSSYDPDGYIVHYDWAFGDGGTAAGETASHTYDAGGTYIAGLTVTDNQDASDTVTQGVTVTGGPPTMHVGDLDGDRATSRNKWTAIVIVTVHDAGEHDVSNATVAGTWSNGASGTGSCQTDSSGLCSISLGGILQKVGSVDFTVDGVTHSMLVYDPAANHDVDGETDGTTITVYLEEPANQPPVAGFTYGCTELTCAFDASTSSDPDGSITAWDWSFGDGQSDTGVTPSHTYGAPGSYTVVLTVTDNDGATGDNTQYVLLGGTPGTMFVSDIAMTGKVGGKNLSASAKATILDTEGNPVSGAVVDGTWSGDDVSLVSGITGADGSVTFNSGKVRQDSATFTFTIDQVALSGYSYDPLLNVETSDTITVP